MPTISFTNALILYSDALEALLFAFHHVPPAEREQLLRAIAAGADTFFENQPSAPADAQTINGCVHICK